MFCTLETPGTITTRVGVSVHRVSLGPNWRREVLELRCSRVGDCRSRKVWVGGFLQASD